jgi:hypothetical protein
VPKIPQFVALIGLLFALAVPMALADDGSTPAAAIAPYGKLEFRAGLREHGGSKLEVLKGIEIKVYRGQTLIATVRTKQAWTVIRAKTGAYRLVWQKWKRGRYVFEAKTLYTRVAAGQSTYASMNYST